MTASDILTIDTPGILFRASDLEGLKREYHYLIKLWHPDVNKESNAKDVFDHIKKLYERSQELILEGRYETTNFLRLTDTNGNVHRFMFLKKHLFELGEIFIGETYVLYVIDKKYAKFYSNAASATKFKYSTPGGKMEKEFSRYLPQIEREFATKESYVVCYNKTPDLLLLKDVFPYLEKIEDRDRHVAWIISTLQNLLCYFQFSEFSHLDISLDTYYISPLYHSGALLGGWWYSTPFDQKIQFLPKTTYSLFYPDFWKDNKSIKKVDQHLVKKVGRQLLGDDDGITLLKNHAAPVAMINYLRLPPSRRPIEEYRIWQDVLAESFGPKKFVKMEIDQKLIYGK